MLFDINSCCSICPSEIFLNIDLEGELVYIFTEPDTGKQLPISEECCEIIGGKNLSQGDEYTGCDACVTYKPSTDLTDSSLGILDYEESTSIKLSHEILSTCCEKDGYHYYEGFPLGIDNGSTNPYSNRCWRCPRVISEETDGIPYKIGDIKNGKKIVDIQTDEKQIKEIEDLIRKKRIELEECKSYQEKLQTHLDNLTSSGGNYKSIQAAQSALNEQKATCSRLESEITALEQRLKFLKESSTTYILIFEDDTTETIVSTTTIIYRPEDETFGNNISEYCCKLIGALTRDRAVTYVNGVCTRYTKSLYE
jgi:hypothetical protein